MPNRDAKWALAVRLRGEVLNSFGQIELAIVGALLWAAAQPDQLTAIPSLSSERLTALRRILGPGEALAERSGEVAPLLDRLEDFRELRNFLAHGMLRLPDLADAPPALRDRAMIEFHFIRTDRRAVASSHYFFDLDDYESLLADLAELADRLTAALPFYNPSLPDASAVV